MSMDDFISLVAFLVDILSASSNLPAARFAEMPEYVAAGIHYATFTFFLLCALLGGMPGLRAKMGALGMIALALFVCIAAGPASLRTAWTLLLMSFPATVFALRAGEGCLIGLTLRKAFAGWRFALLLVGIIAAATVVFFGLRSVPEDRQSIATSVWAVFVAIVAAVSWTKVSEGVGGPIGTIALFAAFLSIYIYAPRDRFHEVALAIAFPASFLVGLFGGDKLELFVLRRTYGLADAKELSADELMEGIRALYGFDDDDDDGKPK